MIGSVLKRSCILGLLALPLAVGCGSGSDAKPDGGNQQDTGTQQDGNPQVDTAADTVPTTCTITPAFKGGSVTTDLVLTKACSPYSIDQQIRVEDNATLTIQPGVTMKFAKDIELTIAYNGAGKLVAEGTATEPIVMTSGAASPAAGDWAGIRLYAEAMAGIKLSYVQFDYCGEIGSGCIVALSGVKPGVVTVDHVTFDHVGSAGISEGDTQKIAVTNTTFKPGAIATGQYAIELGAGSVAAIGAGNAFNNAPINIDGGYVSTNASWVNPGTPFVVTSTIRVEGTASPVLTIAAGTVMQFDDNVGLWVAYNGPGQLVAEGTATAPILMTSKNATPGAGDWEGISLWDQTANGTKLAYVKLDYCGQTGSACIDATSGVKSDRVTIDNVTIDHVGASADGISENGATSRFKITNTTFPAGAIQTGHYAIVVDAASFAAIGGGNVFNDAMIDIDRGTISATTSWVNPGTVIAVENTIRVEGSATPVLTIGAGMTFKFAAGMGMWIGYSAPGKLIVSGTATSHVTMTTLASSPGKGDWEGITVWNSSQATIAYADISYAGGDSGHPGNVSANSDKAVVTVTNSTLNDSAGYGLYIRCDNVTATAPGTTFSGNVDGNQGPGPNCI